MAEFISVPTEIECPDICVACGDDIYADRDDEGTATFLDVTMKGVRFRIHKRPECITAVVNGEFMNMPENDDG